MDGDHYKAKHNISLLMLYNDIYDNYYYYVFQYGQKGYTSASNLIYVINKDNKVTYKSYCK